MPELISKTVRIPDDVVAYIETQPGDTFSRKLLGILEEYRFGEDNRRRRIADYEDLLENQRRKLRVYSETAFKASQVTQQLGTTLRDIDKLFDNIEKAAAVNQINK